MPRGLGVVVRAGSGLSADFSKGAAASDVVVGSQGGEHAAVKCRRCQRRKGEHLEDLAGKRIDQQPRNGISLFGFLEMFEARGAISM